jgi:hypothetical protein
VLLTMKEVNRLRVLQGYMDGKILIQEAMSSTSCSKISSSQANWRWE